MARDLMTGPPSSNDPDHDLLCKIATALQTLATGGAPVGPANGAVVYDAPQSLTAGEQAQALANLGSGRASLAADVTRTNDTLSNTELTALTVALAASSRYRLIYRVYMTTAGAGGWKIAHTWPTAPTALDGGIVSDGLIGGLPFDIATPTALVQMAPDYPANIAPSETASKDSSSLGTTTSGDYAMYVFTFDITTDAGGDFALLVGQSSTQAAATTIRRNTCVEWFKF